jgi:hypothetical protein
MNIILQHFDGDLRPLDELSIDNIQRYAEMVGAKYQLVRGKPFRKHLTAPCQKVHMIHEEFDEYDQVLMLDIDMFAPNGMEENVFDLDGIGLYSDTQKRLHRDLASKHPMVASMDTPYWGGAIYKLDLKARQKLRKGLDSDEGWMNYYNKPYQFEDEGIMHTLAFKTGYKPKNPYLDRKWCQCSFLPNPEKAGFIHIRTKVTPSGPKREKIENYKELKDKGIIE